MVERETKDNGDQGGRKVQLGQKDLLDLVAVQGQRAIPGEMADLALLDQKDIAD